MTTQKQFEDAVKEQCDSPEHAELLLCADKFLRSSKSPLDTMATMAQIVAMSSVNVSHQEDFIHEIAHQAIRAIRFANAMTNAMLGGGNEQTH
jgi:hypothetical protein